MSRRYKHGDRVPSKVLSARLSELSDVVTKGRKAIDREFVMRIPAELDHCPDLVLSSSAERLEELEDRINRAVNCLVCSSIGDTDEIIDNTLSILQEVV